MKTNRTIIFAVGFLLIWSSLFCIPNTLLAQDPYGKIINQKSGLPSNTVYDLFQDKQGFIWIATSKGIARYDGVQFKTFPSIGEFSNEGTNIQEDAFGRIWYQNFDGYLLYIQNDSIRKLDVVQPAGFVLYGITENTLFGVDIMGLKLIDLNTLKHFKTIPIPKGENPGSRSGDRKHLIMINELWEINPLGEIQKFKIPFSDKLLNPAQITQHENGTLFTNKNNNTGEIFYYKNSENSHTIQILPNSLIQNIIAYEHSAWICTPNGTFEITNWNTTSYTVNHIFKNKSISDVLLDREGNYWFSTIGEGIILVNDLENKIFTTPFKTILLKEGKEDIYLGNTENEIFRFNPKDGTNKLIFKGKNNVPIHLLEYNSLKEELYFSSDEFRIADQSGRINLSLPLAVKDIIDIDTHYGIATSGMCGILSKNKSISNPWNISMDLTHFKNSSYYLKIIKSNLRGRNIIWDKQNKRILINTSNGLFEITEEGETILKYKNKVAMLKTILQSNNTIWGLMLNNEIVEIQNKKIIRSELNNNLPQDEIIQFKLNSETLIIRYPYHLITYNIKTKQQIQIPITEWAEDINDIIIYNDKIIQATNQGIISIRNFQYSKAIQPILVLNEIITEEKSHKVSEKINLDTRQNTLDIHFSILYFTSSIPPKLFYQMNEGEWEAIPAGFRNLYLASLSPGEYTINFKFNNSPHICQTLSFSIYEPVWQRTWFISICIFLIMLSLYVYYRWQIGLITTRNKLLTDKMQLEQDLNQSLLTSIRAQMNPHFFYNALNTIQSFIVSDDKKNASSYLNKFSKLTRMILEISEKEEISLSDEIKALQLYLDIEKARFSEDFSYRLIVDPSINCDTVRIPSLFIQPFVENSLKHGLLHLKGEKILELEFINVAEGINIVIQDNGIGRKRSGEINANKPGKPKSFASQAQNKRTDILNQERTHKIRVEIIDKTDAQGNCQGTIVNILIPTQP